MSSITSSLNNLISSFLDILKSIFNTFYSALETVFATASSLLSSIVDLFSGFVGFVLDHRPWKANKVRRKPTGNIVIIGLLVAAFVGYSAYQQKQGRNKKGMLKTS
ncbi:MAG: hypothetical protein LQ339_006646 [Xanthoria mediterranea]|nr:MAG: hypothetical protein LQ339_006646 [Xanthoria mediterranea]